MTSRAPLRAWGNPSLPSLPNPRMLRARATAYFVLMFILLALLPFSIVESLVALGVAKLAIPADAILGVGTLQAVLEAYTVLSKPTRRYGLSIILAALCSLGYLGVFLTSSALTVDIPTSAGPLTAQVIYTPVILLFMIGPAFRLMGGVLVWMEDRLHPGERLRLEFPSPH